MNKPSLETGAILLGGDRQDLVLYPNISEPNTHTRSLKIKEYILSKSPSNTSPNPPKSYALHTSLGPNNQILYLSCLVRLIAALINKN